MFPICFSTLIVFPFVICFAEIRCWASWNRRLYPISPLLYSDQVDGSRLQPLAQLVRCLHSALVALLYTCVAFHLWKSSSLKSLLLSPHVQSLVFSVTIFCRVRSISFWPSCVVCFAFLLYAVPFLWFPATLRESPVHWWRPANTPLVQLPSQGSIIFAPDGASAFGNTSFHCRQEMEKDSGGQNWCEETMSLRRRSANAANAAACKSCNSARLSCIFHFSLDQNHPKRFANN